MPDATGPKAATTMPDATGPDQLDGRPTGSEDVNLHRPPRGCCARHKRCIYCSVFFLVVLIVLLAVLGFCFWPRLILVCVKYVEIRGNLGLAPSIASPFFTFTPAITVPVTIDSRNFWGVRADLTLTAYASGNEDAPVAVGEAPAYMRPNAVTEFDVVCSDDVTRTDEQTVAVATAIREGCGTDPRNWPSNTWSMDLHVEVERVAATSFGFEFWVRDIAMPCDGGTGSALDHWSELLNCRLLSARLPDSFGQFCVAFFCAVDDLECQKSQCPEPSNAPPPSAPPTSGRAATHPPSAPPSSGSSTTAAQNPFDWLAGLMSGGKRS